MEKFKINPGFSVRDAGVKPINSIDNQKSVLSPQVKSLVQREITATVKKLNSDFETRLNEEGKASYQKGFNQGQSELEKIYKNNIEKILQKFTSLINEFRDNINLIYKEEEQNLLNLAISISRKIVDTEIQLNKDVVLKVITNALSLINEKRKIVIKVNPEEWAFVKENLANLKISSQLPDEIEITGSEDISLGSCIIEYMNGSVDADINTQFEEIKRKLLTANASD